MGHTENTDIPAAIEHVSEAIDKLAADERIEALQKPMLQRVPVEVRNRIYGAGKWLGLVGAAGLAVAGVVQGDAERYVEAGGLLLLAVSNWVAKANISA